MIIPIKEWCQEINKKGPPLGWNPTGLIARPNQNFFPPPLSARLLVELGRGWY